MNEPKVKLGAAPVSWGVWFPEDERQMSWSRCLDEISEIGYEWIELGPHGYLPTDPVRLQEEISGRGLRVSGSFIMGALEDPDSWPKLKQEVTVICQTLVSVEASYLIIIGDMYSDLATGEAVRSPTLTEPEWDALIETTHVIARIALEQFGLRAVFHPHAETHVETEAQIERFLSDSDPALVGLCLDTGHHAYRGGDPVRFFMDHSDRIEYLHLKNVDAALLEEAQRGQMPFARAVEMGVFCEPAHGAVNFQKFAKALETVGFEGHATVEQDMFPAPPDKPFAIAQRTYQYLRSLGLGVR